MDSQNSFFAAKIVLGAQNGPVSGFRRGKHIGVYGNGAKKMHTWVFRERKKLLKT
ncbi:MAG TPA: hypothetical protein PKV71_12065 [Calditrichia bacterium]|nr:hypothetical protein [Calditrichota bacterium]HQV32609.1 hypothetical protein [Calditrichia bacterium]